MADIDTRVGPIIHIFILLSQSNIELSDVGLHLLKKKERKKHEVCYDLDCDLVLFFSLTAFCLKDINLRIMWFSHTRSITTRLMPSLLHFSDVTRASWRPKSQEIRSFVQQLFEVDNIENTNKSSLWLAFCEGSPPATDEVPHKGPGMRKEFPCHYVVMTCNCSRHVQNRHIYGLLLCRCSPLITGSLMYKLMAHKDH